MILTKVLCRMSFVFENPQLNFKNRNETVQTKSFSAKKLQNLYAVSIFFRIFAPKEYI